MEKSTHINRCRAIDWRKDTGTHLVLKIQVSLVVRVLVNSSLFDWAGSRCTTLIAELIQEDGFYVRKLIATIESAHYTAPERF